MTDTIIPHTPDSTFGNDLRAHLQRVEGDVRRIYSDSKGIPTMGIGFALFSEGGNDGVGRDYTYRGGSKEALRNELTGLGITLTDDEWRTLDQVLIALDNGDLEYVFFQIPKAVQGVETNGGTPIPENNAFPSLILTDQQVTALIELTLSNARSELRNRLGDQLYNWYDGSKEMSALQSLAFNNPNLIDE